MSSSKPPRIAAWILQHLAPEEETGALAGDLFEEFEHGRTAAWFWRQALAAVAIGWLKHLRGHTAVVTFAALWSVLAPAWVTLMDHWMANSAFAGALWRMPWPWSSILQLAVWVLLSLAFVWAGMLLYFAPQYLVPRHLAQQSGRSRRLSAQQLWRCLLITLALFNVLYVGDFVLMNLLAYPGLAINRWTMTPLGEVVDFRLWAISLRVPYFVTMLGALWGTVEGSARAVHVQRTAASEPSFAAEPAGPYAKQHVERESDSDFERESDPELLSPRLVIAGCIAAVIVECLLCQSVDRVISTMGLLPAALVYVVEAIAGGAIGAMLVGFSSGERSWSRFLMVAVAFGPAWVWMAPTFLFGSLNSAWTLPLAAIGAGMLAVGLRAMSPQAVVDGVDFDDASRNGRRELFAASLEPIPWDWRGLAIAAGAFAAFIALFADELILACAVGAGCAFLFLWQWAEARRNALPTQPVRAARRLLAATLPALLITMVAMMAWIHSRGDGGLGDLAGAGHHGASPPATSKASPDAAANGLDGFQSIILWPEPPKKEFFIPVSLLNLAPPDLKTKQVIRFDGSYWYFHAPAMSPGTRPHIARGDPLKVSIRSTSFKPLVMEADQPLARPVRIAQCGQIEVLVANSDNLPGPISIGLVLTDTTSPHRVTLNLGERQLVSSQPSEFRQKLAPIEETLKFAVPRQARIRRFNEITLIVTPDISRARTGAKIGIEELQIIPR